MEKIDERLQNIFREVFLDDSLTLNRTTSAKDIEGWDSLSNIHLVVAVEKEFKIRFGTSEVMAFKNVGEMLDSIRSKVVS